MYDLKLILTAGGIDLDLKNGDFTLDHTLTTAVLISLFTDTLEPQDANKMIRTWWGHSSEKNTRLLGSSLWRLQRASMSSLTHEQARIYALESLQWLLEDGLVIALDVAVSLLSTQGLLLKITIDQHPPMRIQWEPAQGYITILNPSNSKLMSSIKQTSYE